MKQDQKDGRSDETFRDHLSTIDESGKRSWIFPKKPSGRYYNARNIVAVILLIIFFSGPFIELNGQPILMLNIMERKFIIFGLAFWPQDLHLLLFGALSFIVFVVLFTSVFGRLFCGWACPQTIFMEMVFRRIEYWIEGDRMDQIRLNRSEWNWDKIWKKSLKHGVFFGLAFLISNLFLAYIIGKDQLFDIITDPPSEHLAGLSSILIFSGLFYGVFTYMREQVCHMVCPYGRMQSVLLDNNSINVMYDYKRGEPRASMRERKKTQKQQKAHLADIGLEAAEEDLLVDKSRQTVTEAGDCIKCRQCVKVCPMGIDIRNGTQLECVHCTACIDACDDIMDKIGKPRGLIRYSSEQAIRNGTQKIITPRVLGYTAILLILITTFFTLLVTRPDTETTILRQPGTLYNELPNGWYSNFYEIKAINKTFKEIPYDIRLEKPQGELARLGDISTLSPQASNKSRLLVKLPPDVLTSNQTEVTFAVYANGKKIETVTAGFLGPDKISNSQ